ncbi:MAG TPA: hypothetical protein VMU62_04725, partial [Acidobacteriaceae bacterium]|nr:hypothetical protein [Acidobacteriaceae bacterium]
MTYYVANVAGFIDNYFDLHHRPRVPLTFDIDTQKITSVRPETQKSGVDKGDVLLSANGKAYTGMASWLTLIRRDLHPGETLQVVVRKPNGAKKQVDIVLTGNSGHAKFREWGSFLFIFGIPPLICLLVGYWVVAARPRDPFAWLILVILTFTETLFSIGSQWWPGAWDFYIQIWMQAVQSIVPLALLLFGLYFPERWRLDRKLPWLKWLVIAPGAICTGIQLWIIAAEEFNAAGNLRLRSLNHWTNLAVLVIDTACVFLYWIAIFDKSRSASTADARRRLRVLGVGSVIGLGTVLAYAMAPVFHIDNTAHWVGITVAIIFLSFPFTLAYVVVVQRAMDVRILLRMGTKYALARATLTVVRTGVLTGLIVLLIAALRSPSLTARSAVEIAVLAGLLLLLRSRFTKNLSSWLDRRFFREAYNSEQLLAELSHRVRKYNESGPMLEMVLKSLAETLHIDKIAVLLRGGKSFQLQQAVGIPMDAFSGGGSVQLPMNSTT